MAIVMLSTFEPGQVPGLGVDSQRSHTDVATYAEIWNAARSVLDTCIEEYSNTRPHGVNFMSSLGWTYAGIYTCPCFCYGDPLNLCPMPLGDQQDIGIFFLDANSALNQYIFSGPTILVKSSDLPSLNVTKASRSRSLDPFVS